MSELDKIASRIFNELDQDESGRISIIEFIQYLKNKGYEQVNAMQVKEFINCLDSNRDGSIDFRELKAFMQNMFQSVDVMATELFEKIDTNRNGSLDFKEVWRFFSSRGYNLTSQQAQQMIKLGDANGDYQMDLREFIQFYKACVL